MLHSRRHPFISADSILSEAGLCLKRRSCWAKTRAEIARLHYRIVCQLQNAIHQTTSRVVAKTKPDIWRPALGVMGDLNVMGMMQPCTERS